MKPRESWIHCFLGAYYQQNNCLNTFGLKVLSLFIIFPYLKKKKTENFFKSACETVHNLVQTEFNTCQFWDANRILSQNNP